MKWSDVESAFFSQDEQEDNKQVVSLVASIIKRRLELRLTQKELAELAGLKQSAVARFESLGATPRIDTLCRLARVLKLEVKLV